mmetsp:Transcript_18092/g.32805  ORF Transcript_18092/g.32805 Transcript_18092/m.32805 type:complete len:130 (-) Transcript_18092:153-542(-)|eukprot:CAMPEP_0202031290 /NCGR_PEP_ID=MMETSP0905-20130828/64938_1 /ASSEMBLY_ACC=CAM_ASM_000554 /TAXON_ID=420261 /ORGANISM="Thalassiosira antarctica, Strain CCMP982" /LENGTH=129 /DNA_ID=CAMNT_0048595123 /DNA_START=429 /DNA_END=818 /DNA_ORIENTATION=-
MTITAQQTNNRNLYWEMTQPNYLKFERVTIIIRPITSQSPGEQNTTIISIIISKTARARLAARDSHGLAVFVRRSIEDNQIVPNAIQQRGTDAPGGISVTSDKARMDAVEYARGSGRRNDHNDDHEVRI